MNLVDTIRDHILHWFTPHHSNNHRPRLLHPESLLVMIAIVAVIQIAFRSITLIQPGILGIATNITIDDLMSFTNQERSTNGLGTLLYNPVLSQAAQKKAQDMFADNYWAHNSPDGTTPWDFIIGEGYNYTYAGENLARDFNDSQAVVTAWMNSPSHRDNILRSDYREIGFAVVNGVLEGEETTLVVQMFGTPQRRTAEVGSASVAFQPPVEAAEPVLDEPVAQEVPEEPVAPVIEENAEEVTVISAPHAGIVTNPLLDEIRIEKSITLAIAGLLIGLLAVDGILIWKRKTLRIAGHNMAHFIFLLGVLGLVILSTQGSIL